MTVEQHYTTKQLADLMGSSQDTVLRLAQRGELDSVFWGRERRYPESAVNRYLERSARKAAPSADVIPLRKVRT